MKKMFIALMFVIALCGVAMAKLVTGTVQNVTLTAAGTEYSVAMPANTTSFTIKSRTAADFKMAVVSGSSATSYITVKSGEAYYEASFPTQPVVTRLYFQSANAGQVIEVISWQVQ
jgi:hypothetical protein